MQGSIQFDPTIRERSSNGRVAEDDKQLHDEGQTTIKGDVLLNICEICLKSYHVGHKGCCSTECYLKVLESKLDACFKNDKSHTQLLIAQI